MTTSYTKKLDNELQACGPMETEEVKRKGRVKISSTFYSKQHYSEITERVPHRFRFEKKQESQPKDAWRVLKQGSVVVTDWFPTEKEADDTIALYKSKIAFTIAENPDFYY